MAFLDPRPALAALALAGATVISAPGVLANGNHQSAPLGGRSALMGGTGVALGVDGAAPFLNPATIARIDDGSLAFSSRFFRFSERTILGFHQPGPVDAGRFGALDLEETSVTESELDAIPDSACYFFGSSKDRSPVPRAGRQRFAVCLAKVEEAEFFLNAISFRGASAGRIVDQTQSLRQEWSRRSGGPSWAYYLTDRLAVGASAFVSRSKYRDLITASTVVEDSTGSAITSSFNSSLNAYSWDLLAHLGLAYRLSERLTLGVSVRTPSVHVLGGADQGTFSTFDDGSGRQRLTLAAGSYVAHTPPRIGAGIGAEWSRLRLEVDGFFYAGDSEYARLDLTRDVVDVASGSVTGRSSERVVLVDAIRPVLNGGIGIEWFAARDLSLLAGVETDLNALPELRRGTVEGRVFRSRLDTLSAGFGAAYYSPYGDLLIGLRGDYGTGELAAHNPFVEPSRLEVVDQREWGVMLIVAGRLSVRNLSLAADRVDDALEGAAPEPAETPRQPLLPPRRD
jgi:hypothetical protein